MLYNLYFKLCGLLEQNNTTQIIIVIIKLFFFLKLVVSNGDGTKSFRNSKTN